MKEVSKRFLLRLGFLVNNAHKRKEMTQERGEKTKSNIFDKIKNMNKRNSFFVQK